MPLFQPSNITPSSFAGVGGGTVAVVDKVKITWQVNGNVPMTAYKIDIFDMDNNSVYSSDILTDNTPFYPTDNKGNPQYFSYEPNATWASWGLSDGNEYTLQITQWWGGSTDNSHSVTQFSQSSFITRTIPILEINDKNLDIDNSIKTFSADYQQAQGDAIDYSRWVLYDLNGGEILEDTGIVYTSKLEYTYDGFFSGRTYELKCYIQTESGVQQESSSIFSSVYSPSEYFGRLTAKLNKQNYYVELSWEGLEYISPIFSGQYKIIDEYVFLYDNSYIEWKNVSEEEMNFLPNWSVVFSTKVETTKTQNDTFQIHIGTTPMTTVAGGNIPRTGFNASTGWATYTFTETIEYEIFSIDDVNILEVGGIEYRNATAIQNSMYSYTITVEARNTITPTNPPLEIYATADLKIRKYQGSITRTFEGGNLENVRYNKSGEFGATTRIKVSGNSYTITATSPISDWDLNISATIIYSGFFDIIKLFQINSAEYIYIQRETLNDFSLYYLGAILSTFSIPNTEDEIQDVTVVLQENSLCVVSYANNEIVYQEELNIQYVQNAITSVSIYGEQKCNSVSVYNMNETAKNIFDLYTANNLYKPAWNNSLYKLYMTANFIYNIEGGTSSASGAGVRIYRKNQKSEKLENIATLGADKIKLRDFGLVSNQKSTYRLHAYDNNGALMSYKSIDGYLGKQFNGYLLLATTQDEEQPNVFHVVHYWRFGNNIEAGSISNNNAPNFLNNFTGYRLKQPTARKGKSGALTALLSNVANGEYKDTTLQMENLYALSECNNPIFLKDMKGNLYMVTVSAPITQTINTKSAYQEVKVSIPWEEIGSAKAVSIIQLPTDEGWIDDNAQLAEVRLEVDEETGMLKVIYPDDYNYATTFSLVRPSLYTETANGAEEADLELVDGAVILNGNSEE